MPRKRTYHINLSSDEKKFLKSQLTNKKNSVMIQRRCQILLALDESKGESPSYKNISASLGINPSTISNTVKKYLEGGVEGTIQYHRSSNSDNARRKVDGKAEALIIQMACSDPPEGFGKWSLRLLEKHLELILDEPVSHDTEAQDFFCKMPKLFCDQLLVIINQKRMFWLYL